MFLRSGKVIADNLNYNDGSSFLVAFRRLILLYLTKKKKKSHFG